MTVATNDLRPKYKRVVLKLSGEGFGYPGKAGISIDETLNVARQAKRVLESGVELAIVLGKVQNGAADHGIGEEFGEQFAAEAELLFQFLLYLLVLGLDRVEPQEATAPLDG